MNLKIFFILLVLGFTYVHSVNSFAKLWRDAETSTPPKPTCSPTGTITCFKGFKPNCPQGYSPSCVFVGTKQLPACLEDSKEGQVAYNYYLDKISCVKDSKSNKKK